MKKHRQNQNKILEQLEMKSKSEIRGHIGGQVWSELWGQLGSKLWGQLANQLKGKAWGQMENYRRMDYEE